MSMGGHGDMLPGVADRNQPFSGCVLAGEQRRAPPSPAALLCNGRGLQEPQEAYVEGVTGDIGRRGCIETSVLASGREAVVWRCRRTVSTF